MKLMPSWLILLAILSTSDSDSWAEPFAGRNQPHPLPVSSVEIRDSFWAPKLRVCREKTIPISFPAATRWPCSVAHWCMDSRESTTAAIRRHELSRNVRSMRTTCCPASDAPGLVTARVVRNQLAESQATDLAWLKPAAVRRGPCPKRRERTGLWLALGWSCSRYRGDPP